MSTRSSQSSFFLWAIIFMTTEFCQRLTLHGPLTGRTCTCRTTPISGSPGIRSSGTMTMDMANKVSRLRWIALRLMTTRAIFGNSRVPIIQNCSPYLEVGWLELSLLTRPHWLRVRINVAMRMGNARLL